MSTISECIMFTVLTSGFDSNGGGNITRERACANTGTLAVLIKRLKKAMCAFAWRNPCDVDFSIRLTEVTPTRVRVTVTVSREVKLNFSFVAKKYFYFFPERCSHEK